MNVTSMGSPLSVSWLDSENLAVKVGRPIQLGFSLADYGPPSLTPEVTLALT
jgi:hypothetical protein